MGSSAIVKLSPVANSGRMPADGNALEDAATWAARGPGKVVI